MPQTAIAALYHAGYHTINKHISAIRHLLHQTGHTIQPSPHQLVTLDDLCQYATEKGITIPANIKTAS